MDKLTTQYTPDPLVIAILLSLCVTATAMFFTQSFTRPLHSWDQGFWKLLNFTLQMAMILLGGYIVATAPVVKKHLILLAEKIKTPRQAIVITTLLSCSSSWLNWGFGLVVSAIFAQEVGRQLKTVNYRLLVASSYSGFILWHGGLSGSIPLLLNSDKNFSYDLMGRIVPLQETIFSHLNIVLLILVTLSLIMVNTTLHKFMNNDESHLHIETNVELDDTPKTPADKLNQSHWIVASICGLGLLALAVKIFNQGFIADLNNINYLLFFTALFLQKNIKNFMNSVLKGSQKLGPLLVQYPFYAGIMTVLSDSGLAQSISNLFISISNKITLPFFTFLSAGLVNILVPSGGGQWAVQGPIIIPAALQLKASVTATVMAVAWGDAWTNLLQPFWALPLLAIANLKIKDILGFCLLNLLVTGIVISFIFLVMA
ncbi:MAG: short-chain fatty acid transporter [Bdellovibrionales bacterium]|nr:short-chain fatty acid transporter [Bdellovibrionales bacterium]